MHMYSIYVSLHFLGVIVISGQVIVIVFLDG